MLRFLPFLLTLTCFNAFAYNHAVILSDSLADEGRIYTLSNETFPPQPYVDGHFSNGPTWPAYAHESRENYAYGGAKSDFDNVLDDTFGALVANTGLLGQVEEYLVQHPTKEELDDTVFYIAIGGNDLLSLSDMDEDAALLVVKGVLDNIRLAMHRLETAGATHFAFVGLPDLAVIPAAKSLTPVQRALTSRLSQHLNNGLIILARRYDMQYISMDDFSQSVFEKAAEYGFTNITDACVDAVNETVCDNPEAYFFWDDIHPTTRVHAMFGAYVAQQ